MQILMADGDRHLLELMRGVVEGEGHRVHVAETVERARDRLHQGLPDLMLSSLDFRAGGGFRLVRELRSLRGGDKVHLIATTARRNTDAPDIRHLVSECRLDAVLRKPFPLFDLVDQLRDLEIAAESGDGDDAEDDPLRSTLLGLARQPAARPRPDPAAGLSAVKPSSLRSYTAQPLDPGNVRRITGLWARRASGLLRLAHGPGGASGWMHLAQGGPLDSDGWELVSAALHGGELDFEPQPMRATSGEQLGLGSMLFGRIRDPDAKGFLAERRSHRLSAPRHPDALASLPLTTDTRRLLERARTDRSLGAIIDELGLSEEAVGPDLRAVVEMGLVDLHGEDTPTSPGRDGRSRSDSSERSRSDLRERILARRRQVHGGRLPAGAVGASESSVSSLSTPTAIAVERRGDRSEGTVSDVGGMPPLRRRMALRGRNAVTRRAAQASARQRRRAVERLQREYKLLQGQPPAVVLGLPADAPASMARQAGERMIARYEEMTRDPLLPRAGQELARQILALVKAADERMRAGGDTAPGRHAPATDAERWLEMARGLIERQEWSQALVMLQRARDAELGNPSIMACLGWVTLHDPSLSEEKRREEGSGLLLLAVQFGPEDFDANYYLARYLQMEGQFDAALARAARALKARPDDPAARALVRTLGEQARKAPPQG